MWQVPLSNLVFLLLPLALVEEIGWRGYLQPRLIARFGPFWGIFCVGVVWSAFHFSEDLHLNQTDAAAIRFLFGRVVGGIAIGFFLSWLTLRSRSVWPAAIAHAAINGLNFRFYYTSLCIWILVDVVLFFIWRPFRRKVKAIAQGGRERELIGEKFSPS
jgi:membrane protease YdiL (CAAX protease family)